MKKSAFLTLFLALILCVPIFGNDILPTAPSGYVLDENQILSNETIRYVRDLNKGLESEGAQVAVAVLNDLRGQDIESFSNELFRKWGVGDKEKNNGVLLVIGMEEREVRIEVGYGLEGAISDGVAGRIIRNVIVPEFQNGDYDKGILNGVKAITGLVQTEYNITIDEEANAYLAPAEESDSDGFGEVVRVIVIIIILMILFGGKRGRGRRIFFGGPTFFGGGGGFGGSGGGGFGGFGGGSSGGGGASGRW